MRTLGQARDSSQKPTLAPNIAANTIVIRADGSIFGQGPLIPKEACPARSNLQLGDPCSRDELI